MGRPLRIEYPGALYHVTSRGNERMDIFLDDWDRKKFLGILEDYHDRYGILIHCYILMGSHYHLVLETPQGNLLKVMHGINSGYTGYFNRKYDRVGHLFQGRGGRNNTPKKVAIYLIKRYAGLSNQEIGKLFGGMHYSAVSKSSARFEKEMAENRRLSTLVNGLMSKVKT